MNTISIIYTCVWQLAEYPNYQFTKCGICFNVKTKKQLKQVYNAGCIGYNIKGKFMSLTKLRPMLEKIKDKEYEPFKL